MQAGLWKKENVLTFPIGSLNQIADTEALMCKKTQPQLIRSARPTDGPVPFCVNGGRSVKMYLELVR